MNEKLITVTGRGTICVKTNHRNWQGNHLRSS